MSCRFLAHLRSKEQELPVKVTSARHGVRVWSKFAVESGTSEESRAMEKKVVESKAANTLPLSPKVSARVQSLIK